MAYGVIEKNCKYYNKFGKEITNIKAYLKACENKSGECEMYNITEKNGKYYNSKGVEIKNINKYLNTCKGKNNSYRNYDNDDNYHYSKKSYNDDFDNYDGYFDMEEEGYFDEDNLRD